MAVKRITSIPGVTILPYWQAPKYTPSGMREVRAIAWHFAQGGGTDSWLTRSDGKQGNNSSHLVVKYDGSVRQLVEFDDAAWSLHLSFDADTNDAPDYGIFGLKYAKASLGTGVLDPNRYIIAIEVEGYFQTGPTAAQRKTIPLLAKYLEGQFPLAEHLGHRDFQDYKPCPGPTLFTNLLPHASRYGGSITTPETDMAIQWHPMAGGDGQILIKEGRGLIDMDGNASVFADPTKQTYCRVHLIEPFGEGEGRQDGYLVRHNNRSYIALDDVVVPGSFIPKEAPATVNELAIRQAEYDRVVSGTTETTALKFPARPE